LVKLNEPPESAPAGRELAEPLRVRVTDGAGGGLENVEVEFAVPLGGGTVEPQRIRTAADGSASVRWTLGVVPVANRLRADVSDRSVRFNTRATLDAPYVPEPFANVNEFMNEQGIGGSTEDLAFAADRVVLGVPGGLLQVDPQGVTSAIPLTGDPLVNPLGVAFDQQDNLWVADSQGHALRRVSPSGVVTTVLTDDGSQPLRQPNYVGVDVAGRVYLSDPCLGELLRYDPAAGAVDAILTFDLPNEGGPNGFAFDEAGERLYIATENTSLFCQDPTVGLTDPIAGLFSVAVSDAGFGERQDIVTRFALFGDGVAFDREGNLYAIFDTQANFMLEESAVWVLTAGATALEKLLSVNDHVLANLAFGRGEFGNTTLYIALLAVPPFTPPEARGLERFATGIRGLRVPPQP
jgi:sugar lactone lactonase YvrE